MKLKITNEGEFKVKIMTRVPESGNPDSSDYDNGIREVFIEPGAEHVVDGQFSVVEYTPTAEFQFPESSGG